MRIVLRTIATVVAMVWSATMACADVLVTAEEAQLPPPKGAVAVANRGITRGPKIEFVQPSANARSPAPFMVKFESFGGATIDLNAVKLTYLRAPAVDVTMRIKPFLQPSGITMPNAELPPGDHFFRIDVTDTGGRTATTSFILKIAP